MPQDSARPEIACQRSESSPRPRYNQKLSANFSCPISTRGSPRGRVQIVNLPHDFLGLRDRIRDETGGYTVADVQGDHRWEGAGNPGPFFRIVFLAFGLR